MGGPSLLAEFKRRREFRVAHNVTRDPSTLCTPVKLLGRPTERRPACACGRELVRCDECGQLYCNAPGHAPHVCRGAA